MKQPGKESMPMPLGKAADILGHTKPGDLAAQADFLVGQAAELAGESWRTHVRTYCSDITC